MHWQCTEQRSTLYQNTLEAVFSPKFLLWDFPQLESLFWSMAVTALLTEQNRIEKRQEKKNLSPFPTLSIKCAVWP